MGSVSKSNDQFSGLASGMATTAPSSCQSYNPPETWGFLGPSPHHVLLLCKLLILEFFRGGSWAAFYPLILMASSTAVLQCTVNYPPQAHVLNTWFPDGGTTLLSLGKSRLALHSLYIAEDNPKLLIFPLLPSEHWNHRCAIMSSLRKS